MATHPSPLIHVHRNREGVPLEPSLLTLGVAAGAIVAIVALVVSVIAMLE